MRDVKNMLRWMIGCVVLALTATTSAAQPGTELSPLASTLKVMTFNIRFGTANDGENSWPMRRDMVLDVIDDHDADILGLQEALDGQIREIIAGVPGYAVIGVGRDDGRTRGEYTAILYKADRFTVDDAGTFWLSDTPDEVASVTWGNSITRICTWARLVELDSGRGVYVFNAHLDHVSQPSRERSTELIARRVVNRDVPADPVVVLGDFNAGEQNPAMLSLLENEAAHLVNAFREAKPDERSVGTFNGFQGRVDGEMIDHVFVTHDFDVIGAGIDRTHRNGRYPSDHFPVWASLRYPGAED